MVNYLTPEKLKKLKEELEERRTAKRQEIAQRLEEAKVLGDLSENMEYTSAKEAQAFNEGRILELEEITKKATVIKKSRKNQRKVEIGSVVEAKTEDNPGHSREFSIVGSEEAEPSAGKISNESPLGRAFLGHQLGDIIEVETPKKKLKYKITAIK